MDGTEVLWYLSLSLPLSRSGEISLLCTCPCGAWWRSGVTLELEGHLEVNISVSIVNPGIREAKLFAQDDTATAQQQSSFWVSDLPVSTHPGNSTSCQGVNEDLYGKSSPGKD